MKKEFFYFIMATRVVTFEDEPFNATQVASFNNEGQTNLIDNPGYWSYCPISFDPDLLRKPFVDMWKYEPQFLNDPNNGLEEIANANKLYDADIQCRKNVGWKDSVQNAGMIRLSSIRAIQRELRTDKYKQKPPNIFEMKERGKTRLIKSNYFRDRIVQKSLNDNVLFPIIEPKLIYDNPASRLNKGLDLARNRFKYSLQRAYSKWGYDCYVLLMDFSKYFDNIVHSKLLEELRPLLDEPMYNFMIDRFREFEVDVSYMSDEEFAVCTETLFNSLDYNLLDEEIRTKGEKFMGKSMGIGSQTSQISGLFYPHQMDNYCKVIRGIKEYGRYMDDTYLILQTKEEINDILHNGIIPICNSLGIHINMKKTRILKLNNPITYLKLNYLILPTGKVITKVLSESFTRERKRMARFRHLVDLNRMSLEDALCCYKGWRGTYIKYDSGYDIKKLDDYVLQLFPEFNRVMFKKGGKLQ